jgi:CubicO group peptidase (beta-lactamase class C family)
MKKINIFLPAIIILTLMTGCLKEDPMKQAFTGFDPVDIGDGWTLSTPSAEFIDSLALDRVYKDVYANDDYWMTKSLLVFRNGKLVAESYLKDDIDRTRIDAVWSCTKQVNSIITGIAIDQGYIGSVTDPASEYLPEYIAKYPDKASLTLENLLMMGSGVAFDNATQSDVFRKHLTDNSIDYVLGLKLNFEPGTGYNYNDGDPQVVSGILQAATGKPLDEYGKEVLFDPLGITNYKWERYSDGVTLGGFGILTCPRELAKIAECVLDSGRHNGQQVIPLDWWEEMLSIKVPDAGGPFSFGYFWWSVPSKGYKLMWGHGGQYAFIVPEKRLMVVITSLTQVDDDVNVSAEEIMSDIVDRIATTAMMPDPR